MSKKGVIGIVAGVAVVAVAAVVFLRPYSRLLQRIAGISLFQLVFEKGSFQQTDNKVNFLLLGKAGSGYAAPDLTDSIIVISADLKRRTIATVSIPRDIWSEGFQDKINTAYFYGSAQGNGLLRAKSEIAAVSGIPLHYAAVIDFSQFAQLIEYVGGIDVYIERTFTDSRYPIAGKANDPCGGDPEFTCRYETISFRRGWIHMDGATALTFARSRNSDSRDEGTDFARGARQQKVIAALYEKIMARLKRGRIDDIRNLYDLLDPLIERDIDNKETLYLAKAILIGIKKITFQDIVFPKNLLITPPYSAYKGKYVLIPKGGDFSAIHRFIQSQL